MPKTTTSSGKRREAAQAPSAESTNGEAADSAAAKAEEKRMARFAQEADQTKQVVKRVLDGDESLAAVAKELKITSGKAAFLIMKHRVAIGDVPTIEGKDDKTLLANIATARAKADEYSSWGWLAARSGRSEGFIKSGLAEDGVYVPKAENIATKRSAASKPAEEPAKSTTTGKTRTGSKKRVRGNA